MLHQTQPTQLAAGDRPAMLTSREHLVVRGLARGRAPKQLAADCGVSLATIRCHIQSAKRKTRARTLPELVAITTRREVVG